MSINKPMSYARINLSKGTDQDSHSSFEHLDDSFESMLRDQIQLASKRYSDHVQKIQKKRASYSLNTTPLGYKRKYRSSSTDVKPPKRPILTVDLHPAMELSSNYSSIGMGKYDKTSREVVSTPT